MQLCPSTVRAATDPIRHGVRAALSYGLCCRRVRDSLPRGWWHRSSTGRHWTFVRHALHRASMRTIKPAACRVAAVPNSHRRQHHAHQLSFP